MRAVAVLSVVAYHAYPHQVRGGFVGVDIFFVISGFLISGIIFRDAQAGEFSLTNFYSRRIKRIFPALAVVLFACIVLGWFVLFPADYRHLGRDIGAGAGFVANLELLWDVGYFDRAAELKPLLHLWSLGVEEQFYLVWPLLLTVACRWARAPVALAAILLAVSFVWSVLLSAANDAAAFYLPVTRFWELMLGGILAIAWSEQRAPVAVAPLVTLHDWYRRHRDRVHDAAGWTGLALIVAAVTLMTSDRAFPGWWALMPAIGAWLLIFAGPGATINRRLLGHPVMLHIGLISYPLYLWHWPILAFARHVQFKPPTDPVKAVGICAAFLLAHGTWRFIEKPVRFGAPTALKPVAAALVLAVIGGLGALIYLDNGIPGRFPPDAQTLVKDFSAESLAAYRWERCFLSAKQQAFPPECDAGAGDADAPSVLLWGDSHAAHVYPGLQALADRRHSFRLVQYTASGCPPVFAFKSEARPNCAAINDVVRHRIEQSQPDTVILAGEWALYEGSTRLGRLDEAMIADTVARLKAMGVARVVAIGEFPVWRISPARIRANAYRTSALTFSAPAADSQRSKTLVDPALFSVDARMRHVFAAAGAAYVSALDALCNEEGCLEVVPESGEPVAWDDSHLTRVGSVFFADAVRRELLPDMKTCAIHSAPVGTRIK